MFWSAQMMPEHLGQPAITRLMRAIERVTADRDFSYARSWWVGEAAEVTAAAIRAVEGENV